MSRHVLNIWPEWFARLADGTKTAEVRQHDKDYQIGDRVLFIEENFGSFDRPLDRPPPNVIEATISHILPASVFPNGLQIGYSVLSLTDVSKVRRMTKDDVQ